jgi:hypothetical protein
MVFASGETPRPMRYAGITWQARACGGCATGMRCSRFSASFSRWEPSTRWSAYVLIVMGGWQGIEELSDVGT